MTRDEFIDRYIAEEREAIRTPTGFLAGDRLFTATPCHCGEDLCDGWQMDTGRPVSAA